MTEWLTDWMTDWPTDWLTEWLTDWMADWLNGWLTEWMNKWRTDRLADWLTDWLTDQLTCWLTDCLNAWLPAWWTYWPTDWLTCWLADQLTDWLANLQSERRILLTNHQSNSYMAMLLSGCLKKWKTGFVSFHLFFLGYEEVRWPQQDETEMSLTTMPSEIKSKQGYSYSCTCCHVACSSIFCI